MLLGASLPIPVEVALLAVAVAVVGWAATAPTGPVAIGSSLLSLNGFRENGMAQLAPNPRVDLPVAVVLVCAWALAGVARIASTRGTNR
jgi:hypothetical protein